MSILVDQRTRVIVQGMTGREGSLYTHQMIAYGTNVVGGVTPSKGGEWGVGGRPVFDSVRDAVDVTEANTSLIAVTAPHAADAIYEALDAGIPLVVCITEQVPMLDMMRLHEHLRHIRARTGVQPRLIGANCPGILTPGAGSVGILPGYIAQPGGVGMVSRSSTLMCEVAYTLTQHGIGQSTLVGIGGDPLVGTDFVEILSLFEDDRQTDKVILIGEIGGHMEIEAAAFIRARMTKPVIAYIAGIAAPFGVRMGHAGALIESVEETASHKIEVLRNAGVRIAATLDEITDLAR